MSNKTTKSKKKNSKIDNSNEKTMFSYAKENLFYLSMLSLVFVASTALTIIPRIEIGIAKIEPVVQEVLGYQAENYVDAPFLIDESESFPSLTAQGVLAYDVDSGVTLYEKDPDSKRLPASTVKMMTALVAIEHMDLDRVVEVDLPKVVGQKVKLVDGEKMTVRELVHTLLIFSANDTAEVLANEFPGGRDVFIGLMNTKAHMLRLQNTNYTNPSGLDGNHQLTTARDLAILASAAMENELFADIVGKETYNAESVDGRFVHRMRNTNELLGKVDGVLGVKTGWTENARENLVTLVERDGRRVTIALLGSQDRFGETEELIEWIYSNYEWKNVDPNSFSADIE